MSPLLPIELFAGADVEIYSFWFGACEKVPLPAEFVLANVTPVTLTVFAEAAVTLPFTSTEKFTS